MISRAALRDLVFRLAVELAKRHSPRDCDEYLAELIEDGLREGAKRDTPGMYESVLTHDEPGAIQ